MAGKGQTPHTGRCSTRAELERLVLDLYRQTDWPDAKIGRFCEVSADVVYNIVTRKMGDDLLGRMREKA